MKMAIISISLFACVIGATSVVAQSTISARNGVITTKRTVQNGKQIEKITCREFLALREDIKPQAVAYAVGYNKAKKPQDAVFDVLSVARLVPVVRKTCKAVPQQSFLQRIRADMRAL